MKTKNLTLAAVLLTAVAVAAAVERSTTGIDGLLRTAVEKKQVPMAVAMVADAKGVVYQRAEGASMDAIFSIASMTKPIVAV